MKRSWERLWVVLVSCMVLTVAGCPPRPPQGNAPANTTSPAAVEKQPAADSTPAQSTTEASTTDDSTATSTAGEKAEAGEKTEAGEKGKNDEKGEKIEKKMSVNKESYGKMPDGTEVDLYTMTNANGMKVKVITYGAMITAVETPDRNGKIENITLHRDSLKDYLAGHPYFGCAVGRYANRIAKGKFTLDGVDYTLATNDKENHLHGGVKGFDKQVWTAASFQDDGLVGVTFSLESPDGDEGYPGKLSATVTYSLSKDDELTMAYTAQTDKPTVVNLTNHAYWNLAGAGNGDILKEEMMLNADRYLPVDAGLIPLGRLDPVKDTPMDFTQPTPIGSRIDKVEGGYDHCYVLNKQPGVDMSLAARVSDPQSGRVMEVYTTQPAIQFYTGNFLDGTVSGDGVAYQKHYAFCLETQHYPDSPNQPDFPSTVLRPGEKYEQVTLYKFSVKPE